MLRKSLFFSLLAVSGVASAQHTIPSKIPFQLQNNMIHVHAVIDGKDVNAVVDSGAGGLILNKSLAVELGMKLTPSSSIQAAGGGTGDQSIFPVKIRTLRFGPVNFQDISGLAMNLNPTIESSSDLKVDALLGYPFFENHAVRINYANKYITVYPKGTSPTCHNPIPIKIINNVPVVVAEVKTKSGSISGNIPLIVDLGSRHYNYLGAKFLATSPGSEIFSSGHKQVIGHGIGGGAEGVVYKFAELDVGTQHFHDVTFALTKQVKAFNMKNMEGSLGVPLWKMGVITFDYPIKQLCISTPDK